MKYFITVICLTLFAGCSSNQRKGDNMMAAEQYDQAVFYYEQAYQNNPDDEEITQKLSFARSRLVGANLIEVRMFRQSRLEVKAAKKLNESLQLMTHWKIRADSAIKATIDEEIEFAGYWLNKELMRLAEEKNYNRFSYSLKQYNHIIDAGYNTKTITRSRPVINKLGQQQCSNMKSEFNSKSVYYYQVWQAYCSNFGKSINHALSNKPGLYSHPVIKTSRLNINNHIGVNKNTFSQTLIQQVQDHPWFSHYANTPLGFSLAGKISYQKRTVPHSFSFIYPAKREVFELVKDKNNSKIIKRKLLKAIPVEKTVKVKGQSHIETVSHNLIINAKLAQYNIQATELAAEKVHQTYAHQARFKKKNVYPLKPSYMNKSQWFATIGNAMMTEVKTDLDKAWISAFCEGQSQTKLPRYENAARCAELKANHPLVHNWSQEQFGLKYEELKILLN